MADEVDGTSAKEQEAIDRVKAAVDVGPARP